MSYSYRQDGFGIESDAFGVRRVLPLGGTAGVALSIFTPAPAMLCGSTHLGDSGRVRFAKIRRNGRINCSMNDPPGIPRQGRKGRDSTAIVLHSQPGNVPGKVRFRKMENDAPVGVIRDALFGSRVDCEGNRDMAKEYTDGPEVWRPASSVVFRPNLSQLAFWRGSRACFVIGYFGRYQKTGRTGMEDADQFSRKAGRATVRNPPGWRDNLITWIASESRITKRAANTIRSRVTAFDFGAY